MRCTWGTVARTVRGLGISVCVTALAVVSTATAGVAAERSATTSNGRCTHVVNEGVHEVVADGASALLDVPSTPKVRIPLVIDLHGSGGTGQAELDTDGMVTVAKRHHFAVLAPTGSVTYAPGFAWNIPGVPLVGTDQMPPAGARDDVAFIGDLLDATRKQLCVDASRVYATGISGGGRMASQLACDMTDRIAAIVAVSGLRFPRASDNPPTTVQCTPKRPMPIGAIHGVLDPVNAYADTPSPEASNAPTRPATPRAGSSWSYSFLTAAQRWVTFDRCQAKPSSKYVTGHIELRTYRKCAAGAEVALYVVHDGGHLPPGHPGTYPVAVVNPTNSEADGTELAWRFLSRFRLPSG